MQWNTRGYFVSAGQMNLISLSQNQRCSFVFSNLCRAISCCLPRASTPGWAQLFSSPSPHSLPGCEWHPLTAGVLEPPGTQDGTPGAPQPPGALQVNKSHCQNQAYLSNFYYLSQAEGGLVLIHPPESHPTEIRRELVQVLILHLGSQDLGGPTPPLTSAVSGCGQT